MKKAYFWWFIFDLINLTKFRENISLIELIAALRLLDHDFMLDLHVTNRTIYSLSFQCCAVFLDIQNLQKPAY